MGTETTVASQRMYEGKLISLRVDTVRLTNGKLTEREIVEHPGAVAIVALDDGDNAVMVRQFRSAAERELMEIPAGTLQAGESPIACARRELAEETGYRAQDVEQIGSFYPSPGFCTEYIHLCLATGLQEGLPAPEGDESIEILKIPLSDIPAMVSQGEIRDGKTIAGLLSVLALRRSFDFSGH